MIPGVVLLSLAAVLLASVALAVHAAAPRRAAAPPDRLPSMVRARPWPSPAARAGTGSRAAPRRRPLRAAAPAVAAALAGSWRWLASRLPGAAGGRRRELEAGVPEVLDVLRAALVAGTPPARALQAAAEAAPAPLAPLLAGALRAISLGSGSGRALATAGEQADLAELALAGEALDLAETTGAPPGPVLAGIAAAATDRVRARQAWVAATAQARLSVQVVAAMGPLCWVLLAIVDPRGAAFLFSHPLGWVTLAAAAGLEVAGVRWSARISKAAG